jgi:hypothetical protein
MRMKTSLAFPLIFFGTAAAMAQSAGTFTAAGSMTTARAQHTATLLLDGRVLIAGGFVVVGGLAVSIHSAELYDPSTGVFTATGDMTSAPFGHVATLLPDGRVLIVTGDAVGSLGAELYDPATGTFTPAGGMASSSSLATLLGNGKVLMTGGPNAELFDPATGALTSTGAYADLSPALQLTTNLLADGRVLITGCSLYDDGYCEYTPADIAQLYDPATGTFSLTGAYGFRGGTATLLTNGKVLFAGGATDGAVFPDAKLYDSTTGNFTRTGDMTNARDNYAAALLPADGVLITGGRITSDGLGNSSAEIYDLSSGTFRSIANMTVRRGYHVATLLKDGRVLITGGLNVNAPPGGGGAQPTTLASAEIYTPPLLVPAPSLYSLSGDGQGQGAIWHAQTGQIATAGNPAVAGEVLSMYTTSLADSGVIPPRVAIGGRFAEILYFGASGYPGYNQVNFRVPSGVAPGAATSVRLIYLSRPSNEVTIGVQ